MFVVCTIDRMYIFNACKYIQHYKYLLITAPNFLSFTYGFFKDIETSCIKI